MKHSSQQLRDASEHVHYEVMMFDDCSQTLTAGAFVEGVVRNALLESFTIHTRALLQFCFPSAAKNQDVLAEHDFEDPMTWRKLRGGIPKALSSVDYRVGREIAHRTYDRLQIVPEAKAWQIEAIRTDMMMLIERFAQHASSECLAPSWAALRQGAPTRLAILPSAENATNHITMVNTPSVNRSVPGPDCDK